MSVERITIPQDLLQLKPSSALESVSMSKLARTGTAVLRQITASAQAVAVKVQGQGSMVTVSQRQYDEMVELIRQLREEKSDDGFTQALSLRFDSLLAQMNQPGAAQATNTALFGDPASLAQTYQPGATESKE
jgi:hypothetical protein